MAVPELYLLKGQYPELSKMSKAELKAECEMWRRLWAWVPSEVKYYVARTGTLVGITLRNYKRYLGTLLETHWDLKELELGVADKVYDPNTGEYFFEKKIIRMGLGGIIDIQFIAERKSEAEMEQELAEEEVEERVENEEANS